MRHDELLKTEYNEQYDQYRWIGHMQAVVLTVYGAVTTFSLLAANAIRPQSTQSLDCRWLTGIALVLMADGALGLFAGLALFRSRLMQRRTAVYLCALLKQMGETESWALPGSALRYRALVISGGRFSILDTMNTAFLIAIFSSEALFICGGSILSTLFGVASSHAILGGIVMYVVTLAVTPWRVRCYFERAFKEIQCDYYKAEKGKGVDHVLEALLGQ